MSDDDATHDGADRLPTRGGGLPGLLQGQSGRSLDLGEGGQVLYGGVLCGVAAALVYLRAFRVPVWRVMGTLAYCAPLRAALGRLGRFPRGCCYGSPSAMPWAVQFPRLVDAEGVLRGSPAYVKHLTNGWIHTADVASLPVHPVQLYSSVASGGLLVLLWVLRAKGMFGHRLLAAYVVFYGLLRFGLEFFRGDNEAVFISLTVPQLTSLPVVVIGAVVVCQRTRQVQNSFLTSGI